jgi:hypothetical protein
MSAAALQYRNFTWRRDRPASYGAEAFMLDVAFVALGFVVIGLMGVYAHALRRL